MKIWAGPRQAGIILGFGNTLCDISGEGTERYACSWHGVTIGRSRAVKLWVLWGDQFSKAFSSQLSNISWGPRYLKGRVQTGVKHHLRLGSPPKQTLKTKTNESSLFRCSPRKLIQSVTKHITAVVS